MCLDNKSHSLPDTALSQRGSDSRSDHSGAGDAELDAIAKKLQRLFRLPSPDAPGIHLIGAVLDPRDFGAACPAKPVGVTGKGLDNKGAMASCVGEAAEFASTFYRLEDQDALQTGRPDVSTLNRERKRILLHLAGHQSGIDDGDVSWVDCVRLQDGSTVPVPAELCFRGLPAQHPPPRIKIGLGAASGPTLEEARLHGLLELVERDAVGLWWRGGGPCSLVQLSEADHARVETVISRIRRGQSGRRIKLLNITTDLGVPCVAAASFNAEGAGFAFGFAARLTLADAAISAILELAQMEVAAHIARLKIGQQGEGALDHHEVMALRRAEELEPDCIATAEDGDAGHSCQPPAGTSDGETGGTRWTSAALAEKLAGFGVEVYSLTLTRRDINVPTVRMISPDLQPEPSEHQSIRLQKVTTKRGPRAISQKIAVF